MISICVNFLTIRLKYDTGTITVVQVTVQVYNLNFINDSVVSIRFRATK